MFKFIFGPIARVLVLGSALVTAHLQAQECSFDLGRDTILCAGQNVLLAGPSGALSTVWQNGWAVQYLTADTSGTYWCAALFPVPGENLVVNGDFSGGNAGFSTDLELGTGGAWGPVSLEGTYGISTDPQLLHSNFSSCGDHTGGGSMLVVNGSSVPGENVWCQTIPVEPNTTYAFSAWLMSAHSTNTAVMTFSVNGIGLGGDLIASSITCEWDEFYALWVSGQATEATICIVNENVAQSGNDFALDDIAFAPLCAHTDSVVVTILPQAPEVSIQGVASLCTGDTAALIAELRPSDWPLADLEYSWTTGSSTPVAMINGPGEYGVSVSGRCVEARASAIVEEGDCLIPPTTLTMPNVFSPNADGFNDTFGPIYDGAPIGFEMEVLNRWGQVVFRSTSAQNRWSGRAGGDVLPDGTYYYVVRYEARQQDGSTVAYDLSGHVTLLGSP
ncbi:MAG: gliding motility-associated C-terminal domain-containing protein [Flavobacteriales bacterium]|nr:gliding motility-associated C-terminal domain-containing protein [Flavobacteriales bacterium]